MDRKTELMVSLGTAIGLNCIPCFEHIYEMARETELTDKDIQDVAAIAFKVKNGAAMFIKQAVSEAVDIPMLLTCLHLRHWIPGPSSTVINSGSEVLSG